MRVEQCVDKINDVTIKVDVIVDFRRDNQTTIRINVDAIFT